MEYMATNKRIAYFLMLIYFILAFSIFPAVIPQRGIIMTILVLVSVGLLKPRFVITSRPHSIVKYLVILLTLDVVSNCINGYDPFTHFIYWIQYIALIICICTFIDSNESFDSFLYILFWPSFIGGPIIGIYQLLTGRYLFGSSDSLDTFFSAIISNAGHANSNYTAICMLFCVMLSGAIYFRTKKTLYLGLMIFSVLCVVLTYSRTAIVSMVICIAAFHLFKSTSTKGTTKITIKTLLLPLLVIIVVVLFYSKFYAIIENYLKGANLVKLMSIKESSTVALRTRQWKAAIEVVFNNGPIGFILGFGDGAPDMMSSMTGRIMSAHNYIFGRLSENGVLGFLCALALYFNYFLRLWRTRKSLDYCKLWVAMISTAIMLSYLMISINTWELMCTLTLIELITDKLYNLYEEGHEQRKTANV